MEPREPQLASVVDWVEQVQTLEDSREAYRQSLYEHYVAKARRAMGQARGEIPLDKEDLEKGDNWRENRLVPDEAEDLVDRIEPAEPPIGPTGDSGDKKDIGDKENGADGAGAADDPSESPADDEEKSRSYLWSKALDYATGAFATCAVEDAFRRETWLLEIVSNVLREIDRHKSEHEWRDALFLYDMLKTIFPDNEDYEQGLKYCRLRAHFDYIYGPKNDWQADLREVSTNTVREICGRIEDDYVNSVDFAELCNRGIEHLIVLAEAESLVETFPSLDDADLVSHFVNRLRAQQKKNDRNRGRMNYRDIYHVFKRVVLEANRDSIRLDERVITDEFVGGLIEPLDDFTSVIWPAEVEEFNKHTRGEFVGVGIQITQEIGKPVRVESPLPDSPAYRAGIKPGDFITAVDGTSTEDMTITQAVRFITGAAGTKVTLTILDPIVDQSRQVELVREKIKLRTVRGDRRDDNKPTGWDYMIDPANRVGYIHVSGFMDNTVRELDEALQQLRAEECRGFILDLRFNPGGLLTTAVQMCELFLGEDENIVKTDGRSREQHMVIRAKYKDNYGDLPMIVLVNEFSASASEIVAGALAGLKEACVVGTRTFGKGSVQNLIPISDNRAYLKLTTAHYFVPDEDTADGWYLLHKEEDSEAWGVEPHVVVKLIPHELRKILRLRRERDVLKGKDQDDVPEDVLERRPTSRPTEELPEDTNPDTDPQIEIALNMMRIKLLSDQPWALAPRKQRVLTHANAQEKDKLKPVGAARAER